ncbi:hypothetical protein [Portibacter marinus]|uniref:hypothetical protein n=1 Tax=Portibacter marinus TaxID=2898660 RepID=UPI001F2A317D|nr:hypothetical protein [Portibacter marinus]
MKQTKKFRDRLESDIDALKPQSKKKSKKKFRVGPKKQHFSKYAIDSYEEEEE